VAGQRARAQERRRARHPDLGPGPDRARGPDARPRHRHHAVDRARRRQGHPEGGRPGETGPRATCARRRRYRDRRGRRPPDRLARRVRRDRLARRDQAAGRRARLRPLRGQRRPRRRRARHRPGHDVPAPQEVRHQYGLVRGSWSVVRCGCRPFGHPPTTDHPMRLSEYEKQAQREIERWQHGETSFLQQAIDFAMKPVDWAFDQVVPVELVDRLSDAIADGLGVLNDASAWTYEEDDVLEKAAEHGIEVESVDGLRDQPLEDLDALAREFVGQNAVLAAIEGGGTSLGGPLFIAADIPLLFTINFRLIQQIGGAYGFPLREPGFKPLVIAVYNVAASGSRQAKHDATRELRVAAASSAHATGYRGRRAAGTV